MQNDQTAIGGDTMKKRIQAIYGRLQACAAFLKPMQIPVHSAYTCFFLVLSVFPLLLLLLGLLRYTPLGVRDLMKLLEGLLPEALLPLTESLVEASYAHSSGAVVSVSAVAALWSASRGMFGLVKGLDAVYGADRSRGYFRGRGVSMVYTFLFLVVLVLTLILYVFGNAIVDFLWMTTNPVLMFVMNLVDFRFLLLLGLQTALFTGMYAFLPLQRKGLRASLPGAALAALGWLGSSKLFSVYVAFFARYANIYGSVYALALGMLWLYFCISVLFYGAVFNRIFCEEKWKK